MVKVLHWCAMRISDFAIWLHEKGGNLELWCDERAYRRKWTSLGMDYDVPIMWVKMSDLDPADFKIPMPGEHVAPTPRPITMLDDWDEYLKCVEAVRPITCANCGEGNTMKPIRIDDGAGDDFVRHLRTLPDKEAVALCKHAVKVGPDAHHNIRQLSLSHTFTQWLLDMEHLFEVHDDGI